MQRVGTIVRMGAGDEDAVGRDAGHLRGARFGHVQVFAIGADYVAYHNRNCRVFVLQYQRFGIQLIVHVISLAIAEVALHVCSEGRSDVAGRGACMQLCSHAGDSSPCIRV